MKKIWDYINEEINIIKKKVNDAAEMLSLTQYLHRKPKELSGGQRQRVALGRAIVRDAQVFLMDEPLSNLDPPNRLKVRGEILKFHHENRLTTLYVTHNLADALALGERIAVMREGRFEQVDTPENLMRRPASDYVADFFKASELNPREALPQRRP